MRGVRGAGRRPPDYAPRRGNFLDFGARRWLLLASEARSMGESDLDNGPVSAHICGAFVIRVSMGKSDLNNGPVSAHICGAGPIESLR